MKDCCPECRERYGGSANCYDNRTAATENGRTFSIDFKNEREPICRIKVDACLVASEEVKKCDYVFVRCSNNDHYYVELKGKNINRAYEQITTTITTHLQSHKDKNYGFIICSKVPKAGTDVAKLKEDFIKKHGRKLEVKQNKYTHVV